MNKNVVLLCTQSWSESDVFKLCRRSLIQTFGIHEDLTCNCTCHTFYPWKMLWSWAFWFFSLFFIHHIESRNAFWSFQLSPSHWIYYPTQNYATLYSSTVSAWIRYTGIQQTGRVRGFPISVIANGDSNHFQPFIILQEPGVPAAISCNAAGSAHRFNFPEQDYNMDYWAKMTLTYKSDGVKSASTFYINGSLVSNYTDYGKLMRWSDSTTLVVGT